MKPIVTLDMLHSLDACEGQIREFERVFPAGEVEVTVDGMVAVADMFEWGWAGSYLLNPPVHCLYCRLGGGIDSDHNDVKAAARMFAELFIQQHNDVERFTVGNANTEASA